jgi:hypothetical protein
VVFGALEDEADALPERQTFLLALMVPSLHRNLPFWQLATPPFFPEQGVFRAKDADIDRAASKVTAIAKPFLIFPPPFLPVGEPS